MAFETVGITPPSILEAWAAATGRVVAFVALLKQWRDEKHRTQAVDGRISAQALAAHLTVDRWLVPWYAGGSSPVQVGTNIFDQFGDVQRRFELLTADAPIASKEIARSVLRAYVRFHWAWDKIRNRLKVPGAPDEDQDFRIALQWLMECRDNLSAAIGKELWAAM